MAGEAVSTKHPGRKEGRCVLCPRECGADREKRTGFCHAGAAMMAARASLHFWEEPCISGKRGSGAVFFSGCSLQCVYCQNRQIALGEAGGQISRERLYEIFWELKEKGAENINLVTGGHFLPQIVPVLRKAKENGFPLPVVWNCSGYEKVEALECLEGLVDIYLPDFKYMDPETAKRYSAAPDYPSVAVKALSEMVRQCPSLSFREDGMLQKGVLVRHLLLPGQVRNAKRVLSFLHETYGDRIYISILGQYTPMPGIGGRYPELARKVTKREYEWTVDYALEMGIRNAYIQNREVATESFIPPFDGEGI